MKYSKSLSFIILVVITTPLWYLFYWLLKYFNVNDFIMSVFYIYVTLSYSLSLFVIIKKARA